MALLQLTGTPNRIDSYILFIFSDVKTYDCGILIFIQNINSVIINDLYNLQENS